MFDYKKPCNNCPFRKSQASSYRLGGRRIREIFFAQAFECHKTTGHVGPKHEPQQCVGLIALQTSEQAHNMITSVAMSLTGYNPSEVDATDTFETLAEAVEAHGGDE